jgi:hypothetical protein
MKHLAGFLAVLASLAPAALSAATITYGFDDGTFQGWELIGPDGSPFDADTSASTWISSNENIDIADGFFLLSATSGEYRVIPDPWGPRDCLGGNFCLTAILRSPSFFLDGSGPLAVDMMGGGAQSNQPFNPDTMFPPEEPEDLPEERGGTEIHLQGFALLDVEANQYVAWGFGNHEKDGKARPTDPPTRADWETVTIPQDELAQFANNGREYKVDIFDAYSGGWGWIGFDTVRIPGRTGAGITGDFDGNGALEAADIDLLTNAVLAGSTDTQFDVNGDSSINGNDRLAWVNDLKMTYMGDSNLDGEFNSSDFVFVFQAGQYEDGVQGNSTWATGDWNGDLEFDSSDFVIAFQAGGFEQGPRAATAASVPEPGSFSLIALGMLSLLGVARRR